MDNSSTFATLDSDEQKRLLDKLAKLKALSECRTGNVNETATAAATMTRIMLEYQIGMADIDASSNEPEPGVVREPAVPDSHNGFPIWKTRLLSALAKVNHCVSFSSSEPDDHWWVRRTRSSLSLIGAPKDIENTRRLFDFCVEEIERLCAAWGPGQKVKRKNDFRRGAASGIADKVLHELEQVLQEERERARANNKASVGLELFDRKNRAVRAFANQIGLITVNRRSRGVSPDAYSAGYDAGSNLDLGRGKRLGLPAGRG